MTRNNELKIKEKQIKELQKLGAEVEEEFKLAFQNLKIINKNVVKMNNILIKIRETNPKD